MLALPFSRTIYAGTAESNEHEWLGDGFVEACRRKQGKVGDLTTVYSTRVK
jgi:hypothetical protein